MPSYLASLLFEDVKRIEAFHLLENQLAFIHFLLLLWTRFIVGLEVLFYLGRKRGQVELEIECFIHLCLEQRVWIHWRSNTRRSRLQLYFDILIILLDSCIYPFINSILHAFSFFRMIDDLISSQSLRSYSVMDVMQLPSMDAFSKQRGEY